MFAANPDQPQKHKPTAYAEIFQQRGEAYHQAMRLCPEARRAEFQAMLDRAQPQPHELLLDIPSGGGYIPYYANPPLPRFIFMETAQAFYHHCPNGYRMQRHLGDLEALPIESGTVDVACSLAGSHHLPDFAAVWRELRRVLKPQGRFIWADVRAGTNIDTFLNGFVDQHNSGGHEGRFIDEDRLEELRQSGFEMTAAEDVSYLWPFSNRAEMVHYITLLFGLDQATPEQVEQGIADLLGTEELADGIALKWSLHFITAKKIEI